MSTPARPATSTSPDEVGLPGRTATYDAPSTDATSTDTTSTEDVGGSRAGRWSVVVAALCVVATFAASWTFFSGYLALARLPGPIPPMDAIPHTAATAHARTLMQLGAGGYVVALILGVIALVAGVRYARRPDSFRNGVWAIALVVCTPVLALMLLAGMDAS